MRVTSRGRSREHRVLPVTCPVTRSLHPSFPRLLPRLSSTTASLPLRDYRPSLSSSFIALWFSLFVLNHCLRAGAVSSLFLPSSDSDRNGVQYEIADSTGIQAPPRRDTRTRGNDSSRSRAIRRYVYTCTPFAWTADRSRTRCNVPYPPGRSLHPF